MFVHQMFDTLTCVNLAAKAMVMTHRQVGSLETQWQRYFVDDYLAPRRSVYGEPADSVHQAYRALKNDDTLIVCFGGNSRSVLSANLFAGYYQPHGRKFDAFWNPATVAAYDSLHLDAMVSLSSSCPNVLVVGYSGGGALAHLFAYACSKESTPRVVRLITFGCPRSGLHPSVQRNYGLRHLRVVAPGDPVEYVVPHRDELRAARDLNPELQNYAEAFFVGGVPVYPAADGSLEVGEADSQRVPPEGILHDLIDWFTGFNETVGRNAHRIEHYEYLLELVSLNPANNGRNLWPRGELPLVERLPDRVRSRTNSAPSGSTNSAKDQQAVYRESLLAAGQGSPPDPSTAGERRPFRRLRNSQGWYVAYMGLPFLHCSSKSEAGKQSRSLNRLLVLLARYPDDDPALLLSSLAAELQKLEEQ